ncbi:hypothetical protein [Hyphomonas sp.]|uniref:hypothetical protein n=1 Tax=Hyphomonas sp. TaxID=87 RepID=UPI00391A0EEF
MDNDTTEAAQTGWLARLMRAWRAALRGPDVGRVPARRFFLLGASAFALSTAAACQTNQPAPAPPPPPAAPPPPPPPVASEPPLRSPPPPPRPPPVTSDLRGPVPPAATVGALSVPQSDALPPFPWQPPRPTARLELTQFAGPQYQTLGAIADRLEAAANTAGLSDVTYFSVPNGFAMLSRPERIDGQLTPLVPRYDGGEEGMLESLFRFLSGAFSSTIDRRQIALIVTNRVIAPTSTLVDYTPAQLEAVFGRGIPELPEDVRRAARPEGCKVTAMVYHFRRGGNDRLSQSFADAPQESTIARQHLVRAGLSALI